MINTLLILSYRSRGVTDAASQDAAAILEKMDKIIFSPKDKQGKVTIILMIKQGRKRSVKPRCYQKELIKSFTGIQNLNRRQELPHFHLPNDVMWLYMPAFGKPKKISMLTKDSVLQ